MAVNVSVKADIKQATRYLTKVQRKQIPFATSLAINKTLQNIQKKEQEQMVVRLDRPTSQTVKAVRIAPSKKKVLPISGSVFLLDWAAEYLNYQIEGGTRRTKTAVPTSNAKLNKFGNIPGRKTGLLKRKTDFIATIRGTAGVWRKTGSRNNKQLRLIHAFIENPRYKPARWPFYKIGAKVVDRKFSINFNRALADALRTAR